MDGLRVLIVSQYFWPENFRINDLTRALAKSGVEVSVLTGQPNYPGGVVLDGYSALGCSTSPWHEVTVHRIPLMPRGKGSALRLIGNYASFVLSGLLLGPFSLRRKPLDIIFVYAISPILQAIPGILLKWMKGAKLVIWVQDLWPESLSATGFVTNRWALALVRVLVRWIYAQADVILVQSEAFVAPVASLARADKIRYYPNSADDVFRLDANPAAGLGAAGQPGVPCPIPALEQGFSVVFAGNLGSAQAVDTMIDAAERLKNVAGIRFVLVGGGSLVEWLREQIVQRDLSNVVLAGHFPLEAMPGILRRASVLLVTLKDQEIFHYTVPSKVQAYLATGRPIVACLNGEGARVVEAAAAGMCCPAENAVALAETIHRMFLLPLAEREQLGQNGQDYFKTHYDSAMLTEQLIAHFNAVA